MFLRDALIDFATGWRDDLPPKWRRVLSHVEPDPPGVAATLVFEPNLPIYPSRRHNPLSGAREDAHVFRAFDGLAPRDVRCVLLGQDPYPQIARATGRSFEQGNLAQWTVPAGEVASSLRSLVRMIGNTRSAQNEYSSGGWTKIVRDLNSGNLVVDAPRALFDRLQTREGVLFLNTGLTITRYLSGGAPEQIKGHIPFWAPVVGQVLKYLATRPDGQVVFLLLGKPAERLFQKEQVRERATDAGLWGKRVMAVHLPHPVAPGFLAGLNPFLEVNRLLAIMGGTAIDW